MSIIIAIDNTDMQVGQKLVKMDTTAQIVNDRTYIPVRFAREALGMDVIWQSE
ncbi:MAG: stalk domain-containing protein [Candidatus Ornithomonoglobus sp.]